MLDKKRQHINVGAYEIPFSGVGIEYYPLGSDPQPSSLVLHETGYLPDNSNWNFPSVYGTYWRLYYNLDPGHCILLGGEMTELTPENIVLIPDHQIFHCLGQQPVRSFWMSFSSQRRLQEEVGLPVLLEPTSVELALIDELRNMIMRDEDCVPTKQILAFSLATLNIVLCRNELFWQPSYPSQISRAEQFIKKHISEKITNESISEAVGMSKETLYRYFRQYLHTTPRRHIRELRIGAASRMLLNGDASIDNIALLYGFGNRNYFSKVFHDVTGEWPAAFRRKHSPETP